MSIEAPIGLLPEMITARDVIAFARRNYRLLVIGPIVGAIIAGMASFIVAPRYRATTVIVPPKQNADASSLLMGQLGSIGSMAAGASGIKLKDPNDFYIGLLKSRTIADTISAKFNLMRYYQAENRTRVRKILQEATTLKSAKDGMISITVEDTSRKMAMNLANSYIQQLCTLIKSDAAAEAGERLQFFEQQMTSARRVLAHSEDSVRIFLQSHKLVSVEGATAVSVQASAEMRAQIAAREVALQGIAGSMSENNPHYQRLRLELSALNKKYLDLESGTPNLSLGNRKMAAAEIEYYRLVREVKYRELLFEMLAKQYEVARMDEIRNVTHIQIVDPAIEPEERFSPQRTIWVIIGFIFGATISLLSAFISEASRKLTA